MAEGVGMADKCRPRLSWDLCPAADEVLAYLITLQPRGRAWETHDGGPFPGSLRWRFWNAIAGVLAYANDRICKAREEFFCASADEHLDVWHEQYGLPDGCDPFPDLCLKVAAQGAQRCEYFVEVAARAGWTIDCVSAWEACGGRAGDQAGSQADYYGADLPMAGQFQAGKQLGCDEQSAAFPSATAGAMESATLTIIVYLESSPSYEPATALEPQAGSLQAGESLGCGDNSLEPLQCLIERIAPAHALILYRTVTHAE